MGLFTLDERVALITGAGTGLGKQFATTLARAGASVVLAARRRDKLEETAQQVRAAGGRAHCVELDVTDASSVRDCVAETVRAVGAPDILVNNAGIWRPAFFTKITEADWDAVLDTNLKGMYLVGQAVAEAMLRAQKPGSIINVTSVLGLGVTKMAASYIAAKAGIAQLTRAMALELARFRIRVNAIAPGMFATEINRRQLEQGLRRVVEARVPMSRLGELAELDGPILLLASDAGSYMTGTVMTVDGGALCSDML